MKVQCHVRRESFRIFHTLITTLRLSEMKMLKVAKHFVRRGIHHHRMRGILTHGIQQVEGSHRIGLKVKTRIINRSSHCHLTRKMKDIVWLNLFYHRFHIIDIADVIRIVLECSLLA